MLGIAVFLAITVPSPAAALIVCGVAGVLLWRASRSFRSAAELEELARGVLAAPPEPEDLDNAEPISCLECRETIPPGAARCPRCGWSYAVGEGKQRS
jgi:hypothetical protein